MATLNMRLDDDLERRLSREAERAEQTRSEMARAAIAAYLEQRERQRFLDEIARAALVRGAGEAAAMADEALATDNEALDIAENAVRSPRAAYRAKRRGR